MSEIKFNNLENFKSMLNARPTLSPNDPKQNTDAQQNDIAIHLSSLGDMTLTETSAADNARVLEMKNRIQSNNYTINTDALAKKILPHLLQTMGNE